MIESQLFMIDCSSSNHPVYKDKSWSVAELLALSRQTIQSRSGLFVLQTCRIGNERKNIGVDENLLSARPS